MRACVCVPSTHGSELQGCVARQAIPVETRSLSQRLENRCHPLVWINVFSGSFECGKGRGRSSDIWPEAESQRQAAFTQMFQGSQQIFYVRKPGSVRVILVRSFRMVDKALVRRMVRFCCCCTTHIQYVHWLYLHLPRAAAMQLPAMADFLGSALICAYVQRDDKVSNVPWL